MWAIIAIAISLVSIFLTPRVKTQKPSPGAQEGTKADEGEFVPEVYGTCDVSVNFAAFKPEAPEAIKKK